MSKYPEITVKLTGKDGNAFAVMGAVRRELKQADVSADEVDEYTKQSTSGDDDNLLQVAMSWVTVI